MFAAAKPIVDSPYALWGEELVSQGYSAIPCRPDTKRPGSYSGGNWWGKSDWQQYCDRKPSEYELRTWTRWPDAGICVALGNGVVAVDVDTDDDYLRSALASVLPLSYVQKRGEKGFTAFYRGSSAIKSAAFNIKNQRVLDLLAHGKQTVIPPTVHPDTQRPYVWLTEETLLNTPPEALPELPDDIAEQIAAALAPHGYAPQHAAAPTGDGYGHSIWREVNDRALANLDAWVPHLDLPKLKRTAKGFVAVPFWRPSNRGRPLHERAPNLKITTQGIKDFHDGDRGYTPLDVVVKALGCSLDYADDWLRQKIGYTEPGLYGLEPWFPKAVETEAEPAAANDDVPETRPSTAVAAPRGKVDPFAPREADGLLEAIANFVLSNGRRPVPEFAMMTAISFLSALYGRKFLTPSGAGLNVYLVGVAAPGFGKDHALKMLRLLASDTALDKLIGPGEVTSGSAIERVVRRTPSFVMPWDEVGVVLQSVTGRGASSWAQSIRKVLLELYGLSTGVWTGKEHADIKREAATPVHNPTVSLLGMTTPTTFYKGLTEESLADGFVARLTVIEATQRPDRHSAPAIAITPPSLIAGVKQVTVAIQKATTGTIASIADPSLKPTLLALPWESDAAERRWLDIEDWQLDEIDDGRAMDGVIGRAAEHTVKFATLRALSRDGANAKVTVADIEWGYSIVQRSLDSVDRGIRDHMAGSAFEELTKAILAALRRAPDGTLTQSALLRAKGVSKAESRMVTSATERLEQVGDIVMTQSRGGGKSFHLTKPVSQTAA